jgi:hypothetical protein
MSILYYIVLYKTMKKLTPKNKLHLKRRSIYQLKQKERVGKKRTITWNSSFEAQQVKCPENFTLRYENCETVLKFIEKIKSLGAKHVDLNINMKRIKEIGEGAISMLLSVLEEITAGTNITIFGSMPEEKQPREILLKSGFLKFVKLADQVHKENKNTILKTGDASTPQSLLKGEIRKANHTVWGISGRNPIVYGCVFEMMRNSVDHAFKNIDKIKWHWSISHDESSKSVKFSFVDNGKGLISTFKQGALKKLIHLFKDDVDLVETAFRDGIRSRTGLSWRGKGLPTIFESYEDQYIRNLVVITNDIYIDFDSGIKRKLNTSFKGTYYYWILDDSCTKACFL